MEREGSHICIEVAKTWTITNEVDGWTHEWFDTIEDVRLGIVECEGCSVHGCCHYV